jgi:hypothetical protein
MKIFRTKVVEKIEKHVLCSIFFWKSCGLWDNVEKFCRAGQATDGDMTHTLFTLYTWGYNHTLRIYNTYCVSTATVVAETRLNVTLYVHCLSCLWLNLYGFRQHVRGKMILQYVIPFSENYLPLIYPYMEFWYSNVIVQHLNSVKIRNVKRNSLLGVKATCFDLKLSSSGLITTWVS